MTMRMWFCSSGLGPGPSGGTCASTCQGLAGPAIRKAKKTPTPSMVPSASDM